MSRDTYITIEEAYLLSLVAVLRASSFFVEILSYICGMSADATEEKDREIIRSINDIHKKVEEMPLEKFGAFTSEMQTEQPFLFSLLLGYQKRGGYSARQLDGIVKVFGVMWAYFREQYADPMIPIEPKGFEEKVTANNEMLDTWSKGGSANLTQFLAQYSHRHIFTFVMVYFSQRMEFQPLQPDARAGLIYECKSIIDCLGAA